MCGLVGYSGSKPYNTEKLELMMVINSYRRKSVDSTGIYTPNTGILKFAKQADDFILENRDADGYFNINKNDTLFIGHVRAATVGGKDDTKSHPFKRGNYVLAHNGTLSNHYYILSKRNIPTTDYWVDSDYICGAINHDNDIASVIKEINGPAAFLISDIRKPNKLYIFRNEERSLYRGIIDGDTYFSSDYFALWFSCATSIKEMQPNLLYCYENGKCLGKPKYIKNTPATYQYNNNNVNNQNTTNSNLSIVHNKLDQLVTPGYGFNIYKVLQDKSIKLNIAVASKVHTRPSNYINVTNYKYYENNINMYKVVVGESMWAYDKKSNENKFIEKDTEYEVLEFINTNFCPYSLKVKHPIFKTESIFHISFFEFKVNNANNSINKNQKNDLYNTFLRNHTAKYAMLNIDLYDEQLNLLLEKNDIVEISYFLLGGKFFAVSKNNNKFDFNDYCIFDSSDFEPIYSDEELFKIPNAYYLLKTPFRSDIDNVEANDDLIRILNVEQKTNQNQTDIDFATETNIEDDNIEIIQDDEEPFYFFNTDIDIASLPSEINAYLDGINSYLSSLDKQLYNLSLSAEFFNSELSSAEKCVKNIRDLVEEMKDTILVEEKPINSNI